MDDKKSQLEGDSGERVGIYIAYQIYFICGSLTFIVRNAVSS